MLFSYGSEEKNIANNIINRELYGRDKFCLYNEINLFKFTHRYHLFNYSFYHFFFQLTASLSPTLSFHLTEKKGKNFTEKSLEEYA